MACNMTDSLQSAPVVHTDDNAGRFGGQGPADIVVPLYASSDETPAMEVDQG